MAKTAVKRRRRSDKIKADSNGQGRLITGEGPIQDMEIEPVDEAVNLVAKLEADRRKLTNRIKDAKDERQAVIREHAKAIKECQQHTYIARTKNGAYDITVNDDLAISVSVHRESS